MCVSVWLGMIARASRTGSSLTRCQSSHAPRMFTSNISRMATEATGRGGGGKGSVTLRGACLRCIGRRTKLFVVSGSDCLRSNQVCKEALVEKFPHNAHHGAIVALVDHHAPTQPRERRIGDAVWPSCSGLEEKERVNAVSPLVEVRGRRRGVLRHSQHRERAHFR